MIDIEDDDRPVIFPSSEVKDDINQCNSTTLQQQNSIANENDEHKDINSATIEKFQISFDKNRDELSQPKNLSN